MDLLNMSNDEVMSMFYKLPEKWIVEVEEEYNGFTYMVCFNAKEGFRCGYVKIPEGHPFYENRDFRDFNVGYEVNWGLSFSGRLKDHDGWWIGFDCNHSNNGVDVSEMKKYWTKEEFDIIKFYVGYYKDIYGFIPRTGDVSRTCMSIIDEMLEPDRKLL